MKRVIITTIIICISFCLMAQTKGQRKITTTPKTTLPVKGGQVKNPMSSQLDKPIIADFLLSKCDRHLKYHKVMWRVLLNANPSSSNPLELSREISRLRVKPVNNAIGHIIFDKGSSSLVLSPITNLSQVSGYNPFSVPVSGTEILHNLENGTISTIGFHWETGNYGNIKDVTDIYKVGSLHFLDAVNDQGTSHTIRIFPGYLIDGCQLEQR